MNMIIRANIGRQLDIFHDNSDIIYMRKKTFLTISDLLTGMKVIGNSTKRSFS